MKTEEIVEFLERNLSSASGNKENVIKFNHKKGEIIELIKQVDKLKKQDEAKKYVIVLECSAGNEEVGSMWLQTCICTSKTTIGEIIEWKNGRPGGMGRLMIVETSNVAKKGRLNRKEGF